MLLEKIDALRKLANSGFAAGSV